ncbi:hypothetical protein [Rhodococcoides fascians]|uniref:hypothetical protein n=1 Tax=Rhodococcoides fascians TaxID=1828 RepID=UPI000A4BE49F|nr:hypothetical protein [Rhodococcus fascians]
MWQLFSRPTWVDDIQRSLSAINRKVNQIMTTQAEFDTKVSAISSTLAVVAGGVNATLQNTANLEAEIARLKALDIDTSGLDTILGDAKKIEAVLVPAVDPGQVTPPVTEVPVVEPAPDAVVVEQVPVPDESEPVVTVPDETVTTEEPTA